MRKSYGRLINGVALAVLVPWAPALAQDTAAADSSGNATGAGQLQEIVVTAQRRAQNLQDVPISVTAFTGKALEQKGITNVTQLTQVDPSLSIGANTGVVFPFLRGVGNPTASAIGNESSVPVYIDDVYYTRLSRTLLELGNVERVEVLKGPQGTLFGRNASGGALQFFTRDPTKDAFEMRLGYGNFETATGQLYVAKPFGEGNGIDLSVSGRNMQGGWGRNFTTGEPTSRYDFLNIRSKLLLQLSDTTKVRLSGFYYKSFTEEGNNNGNIPGTFQGTPSFYGPPAAIPALPNIYDSRSTFTPYERTQGYGGSVKIDQEIGVAQITSITAYRKATETNKQDGENLPQNFQSYSLNPQDKQFSQELQLKSLASSKISWILGGYYLYSRQGFDPIIVTGDAVPPGSQLQLNGMQVVRSKAVFGQATVPVTETTNITVGARYTWDTVHGTSRGTQLVFPSSGTVLQLGPPYDQKVDFSKFTYRVAVDQEIADRVKAYASISRGYKAGTFNTLPVNNPPADPETVDAYEVGLKSELFDRHVRLNGALFWNDINNPQVQAAITDPISGVSSLGLTNAQKARTKGFELNADIMPMAGLTLSLGANYTKGKYLAFTGAPAFDPLLTGGLGPVVFRDASGKTMIQVPRWRFTSGLNYDFDVAGMSSNFDVTAAYTSRVYFDPLNEVSQSKRVIVNASLTLNPTDQISVRLWSNNVTKKRYIQNFLPVSGAAGYFQTPGAPRTYGLEVGFKL